jgi:hypothetical protein
MIEPISETYFQARIYYSLNLLVGLGFLYGSLNNIRKGFVVGRRGSKTHRESNPVLFWFFVSLYFVAGGGLLALGAGGLLGWWVWWQYGPANPP